MTFVTADILEAAEKELENLSLKLTRVKHQDFLGMLSEDSWEDNEHCKNTESL